MSDFILSPCSRVVEGKDTLYKHQFGGACRYEGTMPIGCSVPLHQLYVFDTQDPLFPVKIPNVRYLPLLYCMPYNAGAVAYRVLSDDRIEILYTETTEVTEDFPYESYPTAFPERPVLLEELSYEDQKILTYEHFDPFGANEADQQRLNELGYPFTQLGGVHVMWQGIPDASCPNPGCRMYQRWWGIREVFAVVWNEPVRGVYLWDNEDPEGCDTQIIFQICSKCHTIHVCNRCT